MNEEGLRELLRRGGYLTNNQAFEVIEDLLPLFQKLQSELAAAKAKNMWIEASDRLPDLSGLKDYQSGVEVIVETDGGQVMSASYASNKYARTEKGRLPRWERDGRILTWGVVRWMPLPEPLK